MLLRSGNSKAIQYVSNLIWEGLLKYGCLVYNGIDRTDVYAITLYVIKKINLDYRICFVFKHMLDQIA